MPHFFEKNIDRVSKVKYTKLVKGGEDVQNEVKTLRKELGLTQTEFGEKIGVKGNTITTYENGTRTPSDAVVLAICREFSVSEEWLRTGRGEMFVEKTESEELAAFFGDLLKDEPDFRHRLIAAMSRLTLDEWKVLEKLATEAVEGIKKDGSD